MIVNFLKKLISILIFFTLLNGCATLFDSATTEEYSHVCSTWIGKDINDLISSWGKPSNEYVKPNGNNIYTWLNVSNETVITEYNYYLDRLETKEVQYWCKTSFTVDKSGEITHYRWEGNNCKTDLNGDIIEEQEKMN